MNASRESLNLKVAREMKKEEIIIKLIFHLPNYAFESSFSFVERNTAVAVKGKRFNRLEP